MFAVLEKHHDVNNRHYHLKIVSEFTTSTPCGCISQRNMGHVTGVLW